MRGVTPISALVLALVPLATAPSPSIGAQAAAPEVATALSLLLSAALLIAGLIGAERAEGVFLGALMAEGTVDERAVYEQMVRRVSGLPAVARPDAEADKGYAALGRRGSEIIRRAQAFQREVLAIVATTSPPDRTPALEAAVRRYRSRPGVALGDLPKDMTILYDHPYTSFVPPRPGETEPRRELMYPRLAGLVWALHWYQLAVEEPLERRNDATERDRGLAIVWDRFQRKLSSGTPPDSFPTELPLAPSIAPGLIAAHDRAAAIIDNLNMMIDVMVDVLVRPGIADRRGALEQVVSQFVDRQYRCVPADEWIVVALRHSIFEQGGFALAEMKTSERNAFYGAHGQHFAVRRAPAPCDTD